MAESTPLQMQKPRAGGFLNTSAGKFHLFFFFYNPS